MTEGRTQLGFACLPGSRQRRIQGELNFSNIDIPYQIRTEIEYVEMYIKSHKSVLHNPDFFFRVLVSFQIQFTMVLWLMAM